MVPIRALTLRDNAQEYAGFRYLMSFVQRQDIRINGAMDAST
jgi:hypothetical protein